MMGRMTAHDLVYFVLIKLAQTEPTFYNSQKKFCYVFSITDKENSEQN